MSDADIGRKSVFIPVVSFQEGNNIARIGGTIQFVSALDCGLTRTEMIQVPREARRRRQEQGPKNCDKNSLFYVHDLCTLAFTELIRND
jgi:hypothetical protein